MISSLIENISPLLSAGFFVSLRLFVNITKKSKPVNDSSTSSTAEIAAHGHVLTPGRYVGAKEVADDSAPFEEKMPCLVAELHAQFSQLDSVIRSFRSTDISPPHFAFTTHPKQANFLSHLHAESFTIGVTLTPEMFDPQKRPVPHSLLPVPATSPCAFHPDKSKMRRVRETKRPFATTRCLAIRSAKDATICKDYILPPDEEQERANALNAVSNRTEVVERKRAQLQEPFRTLLHEFMITA